jgi:hypothetical protein
MKLSMFNEFSGSHEQSPRLLDTFHYENTDSDIIMGPESQLRHDLADAMKDCAAVPVSRDSGERKFPSFSCFLFSDRFLLYNLTNAQIVREAICTSDKTVNMEMWNFHPRS